MMAIEHGDKVIVDLLAFRADIDASTPDQHGVTPLM